MYKNYRKSSVDGSMSTTPTIKPVSDSFNNKTLTKNGLTSLQHRNSMSHIESASSAAGNELNIIPKNGRKLILHFDARNTVFVADLFSRISVEMALNTYISGVVWGVQQEDGSWQCVSKTPNLHPPFKEATSMYKIFEKEIVKTPEDRQILRETLGNFTDRPEGLAFKQIFEETLKKLRWEYDSIDDNLTVTGKDNVPYHYLLPSFLNLIKQLQISGREFCIIVRTFGRDCPHILRAVKKLADGEHPMFKEKLDLVVNEDPELFDRITQDSFTYCNREDKLVTEKAVYDHWNGCEGMMGVIDDFRYWHDNEYHYTAAKYLWYDTNDHKNQHIIFDDNIRVYDQDNIVNIKRFTDNNDAESNNKTVDLDPTEAEELDHHVFVTADLLQSISNPNYFIDKVLQCEENYSKLLKSDKDT